MILIQYAVKGLETSKARELCLSPCEVRESEWHHTGLVAFDCANIEEATTLFWEELDDTALRDHDVYIRHTSFRTGAGGDRADANARDLPADLWAGR